MLNRFEKWVDCGLLAVVISMVLLLIIGVYDAVSTYAMYKRYGEIFKDCFAVEIVNQSSETVAVRFVEKEREVDESSYVTIKPGESEYLIDSGAYSTFSVEFAYKDRDDIWTKEFYSSALPYFTNRLIVGASHSVTFHSINNDTDTLKKIEMASQ